MSTMAPLVPATLSVRSTIVCRTTSKSSNFFPLISSNTAQGFASSWRWWSLISRGLLVQRPAFLGKKSIPTIDSSTDDFPADCPPRTAILGREIYCCNPTSLNSS